MGTVPSETLTSFVPELLARRIGDGARPGPKWSGEPCEMAVLGLDISESTSIIEDLSRWSPDGSEAMAEALDAIFSLLTDVVAEHSGSVVTLAGDEVVAVWPAAEVGGAADAVHWAARAALTVRERVGGLAPVAGYPIRLRAGIGCGPAWLLDVGRDDGHRLFVAVGPALQDMATAQKGVAAAEIGLSREALRLLGPSATVDASVSNPPAARLTAIRAGPHGRPELRPRPSPSPDLAARYVPHGVVDQVRAGHALEAELAPVTVVFLSFRVRPWDEDALRAVGEASLRALEVLDRYGGTVINAAQDLGGLTLVAGFGLPPDVRERRASRAAAAALEISATTREVVEHGLGIATGQTFCGACGGRTYR